MHPWEQLERAVHGDRLREDLERAEQHRRRRRRVRRALKALLVAAPIASIVAIAAFMPEHPAPYWHPKPAPTVAQPVDFQRGSTAYVALTEGRGEVFVPAGALCTCMGSEAGSGCAASLSGATLTVRTHPASDHAYVVCFGP